MIFAIVATIVVLIMPKPRDMDTETKLYLAACMITLLFCIWAPLL